LVVIGIIALLISILLPALNKAREAANTIKCASNLHSIGTGIALYIATYKGTIPASNFYQGLQITSAGQLPATPDHGYVHWSSYLYGGNKHADPADPVYRQVSGWEMFQCPSVDNGGLPPANTFPANLDNLSGQNEDGDPNSVDLQAPRLAYMLNEALTPRSVFVKGFRGATIPYHFVRAGRVRNASETILATEFWGTPAVMQASSNVDGSPGISNSRRPVSALSVKNSAGISSADKVYQIAAGGSIGWATVKELTPNPEAAIPQGTIPDTTLDFVGRNHGSKRLGSVGGDTRGGWDLRKSNFLYLDGHVETKHITETLAPRNQWGERFYSIEN
jgi:prepilin-type processing-associated H-X9-DG protein